MGIGKSKVGRMSAGARCAPLQRGRNRNDEMHLQRWAASLQRLDAFATDGCIAVPCRGAHCVKSNMVYTLCKHMVYIFSLGSSTKR